MDKMDWTVLRPFGTLLAPLGLILLVVFGSVPANGQAALPIVVPKAACADLTKVDLTPIGGDGSKIASTQEVTSNGIATCSVAGVLAPAINFNMVLPTATWTQRYLQLGCGGLCGNVTISEVGAAAGCPLVQDGGFVIAATDMGHSSQDQTWGNDPQKRDDFAFRAQHLTSLAAKAIIEALYGQKAKYSYFNGCSDGGREALVEAHSRRL